MDLQDQLKNLFPDHVESNEPEEIQEQEHVLYVQKEPMICKFEKRKGKATTIIEGYEGSDEDFKILAKEIKTSFRKSFDNRVVMPVTDAPSTLRRPISLILFSAI